MKNMLLMGLFYWPLMIGVVAAQETKSDGIYHDGWIDRNKNGKQDAYENPKLSIEERVPDLISQMTIDEKTCQMGTIYGYKRVLKSPVPKDSWKQRVWKDGVGNIDEHCNGCLLYTSPSPRDRTRSRMPSSA